ncbi:plasmid pRiA4b ORF-3 family protein [Hymenobacter gummosus]|uniref:Plasmid pRiA4b ORF-3 family protein n=1 Tax=Hymenobacter gummosus TaxID=1776032 RepID=A0A431U5K4_9BACT|nr:plasmid pRiA4b ORF-3 family protein [Hymenobacter gummosus]RTQ51468.1 plasmid pRiA4b ORF-3 family protein [Hymenobacter gummosus]
MTQVLQLKVTLYGTKPPVWRRVEVPDTLTFWEFHFVLQILFDWDSSHLFEFRQGRGAPDEFLAGPPAVDPTLADELPEWQQDARDVTLADVLSAPKQKLAYVYDLGDYWEHTVLVEQVQALAPGHPTPAVRCLAGRRAAPPEDIGGLPGYYELLDVLAEKAAGQRKRLPSHFAGLGKYDPEEFELDSFNQDLANLRAIVAEEDAMLAAHTRQLAQLPPAHRTELAATDLLEALAAMMAAATDPPKKPKK